MATDLLHVIEAAYRLDQVDLQWMQGVTDAIGPLIDSNHGVYGVAIDASADQVVLGELCCYQGRDEFVAAIQNTNANLPPWFIEVAYRRGCSLTSAVEVVGRESWVEFEQRFGPGGVPDCAAVTATDMNGVGCVVIAPLDRMPRYGARMKRVWARVASHVAAMQRLRTTLARTKSADSDGEAVLTPDGKLAHAVGAATEKSAREQLRAAAIAREKARGRMRRSEPDEAVEIWQALVAGRWSIVDRFDNDGRRFLIAHENEPQAIEPRALTLRERQVTTCVAMGHSNKLIAYELGLSIGSVSNYLHVAMKKLGLASRLDLARLLRASGRGND